MPRRFGLVYEIAPADPESPEATELLLRLSETLRAITGSSGRASFDPNDVRGPSSCFVIARDSTGSPVGCGAIRPLTEEIAELKRMYAAPGTSGVGSAILTYLESRARHFHYSHLWLETRSINGRAVDFYRRHGYVQIPNFGPYVQRPEAICFGKQLSDESHGLTLPRSCPPSAFDIPESNIAEYNIAESNIAESNIAESNIAESRHSSKGI